MHDGDGHAAAAASSAAGGGHTVASGSVGVDGDALAAAAAASVSSSAGAAAAAPASSAAAAAAAASAVPPPQPTPADLALQSRVAAYRSSCLSILSQFQTHHLIPHSGKVVVFDSQLVVKFAFDGMVQHDLSCAPVWDSWKKKYVGLLSVSDFLDILSQSTHTAQRARPLRIRATAHSLTLVLCLRAVSTYVAEDKVNTHTSNSCTVARSIDRSIVSPSRSCCGHRGERRSAGPVPSRSSSPPPFCRCVVLARCGE